MSDRAILEQMVGVESPALIRFRTESIPHALSSNDLTEINDNSQFTVSHLQDGYSSPYGSSYDISLVRLCFLQD